jgi:hypothetical protein
MLESIWSFLLDFVSKPDQVLLAIIEKYHNWVYVFLFLIIFAETGLIIASFLMPFLPGDALIFTIGLLAQEGSLNIYLVIPLLIFAALFEGHHTADAEQEVAALLQLPVGVGVFGEGVENTPQAQPFFAGGLRFRFDSAAHIFPGRPRMDGDGKVIGRGQAALFRECLELFGLEAVVPVVVESDFAHGAESSDAFGWRAEVAFDQRQLFPPTGIVVDGGGCSPIIGVQWSG